ncbi:MAG: HIT domain-containing protein [Chloroflexi bacterium]|nr:HIT domain-containing protein [Chloroflexota bacterium]
MPPDVMWTPWRKEFIMAPRSPGCFLCEKARSPAEQDPANLVLHRGQRAYILLNLYPYTNGHLLIAPYEHTAELEELEPETADEIMRLTQRGVAALKKFSQPGGFNIGLNLGRAAGAGVPEHVHIHVVPRWSGDVNFMATLGDTRLIPESLDQTYTRLLPYFHRL